MRTKILLLCFFILGSTSNAQNNSIKKDKFEFVELEYGIAKVVEGTKEALKNSPTGNRGLLADFIITKVTDSVLIESKANFGVVYMIKAKDTIDIAVVIEWIFPEKIETLEGKKIKSMKYTTTRPTNIETASSYSLDTPAEMVKGKWKMNIYVQDKLLYSKTFILFN